jgi:hypothetical protein
LDSIICTDNKKTNKASLNNYVFPISHMVYMCICLHLLLFVIVPKRVFILCVFVLVVYRVLLRYVYFYFVYIRNHFVFVLYCSSRLKCL